MTATIVLTPKTEAPQNGDIVKSKQNGIYILSKFFTTISVTELTKLDLYVISDDSIREGDWYLLNDTTVKKDGNTPTGSGKKIIATTDQNLIERNVQEFDNSLVRSVIDDTNRLGFKPLFYDTKLINPMGREVNTLDLSMNRSGCRWIYSFSYGKPMPVDVVKEVPLDVLLSQFEFDETVTPTPHLYTTKQVKLLMYRFIKEVANKPIFDSDEQWINENIK